MMKAVTICSVFTNEEQDEQRFVAFRRSCHFVEGEIQCLEGAVGRKGHNWSTLTET